MNTTFERRGRVAIVTIDRPEARNAVDAETAAELLGHFQDFDDDEALDVAVLTGTGGTFCAGADLKAVSGGRKMVLEEEGPGPMGPSRLMLGKPVIAAIEGHAVAGGIELAVWCDMRVAASDAVLGVFCRRFGVPLMDVGTIRLPRLIGHGRALDLILTGRGVGAQEAHAMGLVDRVCAPGDALLVAVELAEQLSSLPQACLRSDRASVYEQWSLPFDDAIRNEFRRGMDVIASGETLEGATRFASGEGRHGNRTTR
ncbi:MAG: enoyl-CoA hydratase [Actinomycetota bacterium]|nr:enoyl-CoA hydratase [Actinomycetota bacterium]